MGWFWTDSAEPRSKASIAAPATDKAAASALGNPPPQCPMHQPDQDDKNGAPSLANIPHPSGKPASCPRGKLAESRSVPVDRPIPVIPVSSHPELMELTTTTTTTSASTGESTSLLSKLNPLNYMPYTLSQEKSEGQEIDLPVSREVSSIPRADGSGSCWEYPSPQQMYNAMMRKGYTDTPTDAVESMVAVHNFLNEGAWNEILEWERRFSNGLLDGARLSFRGEGNVRAEEEERKRRQIQDGLSGFETPASTTVAEGSGEWDTSRHGPTPWLAKFMGRPDEMTPKARAMQVLGWANPARFGGPPPFDRHDWYIVRHEHNSSSRSSNTTSDPTTGTTTTTTTTSNSNSNSSSTSTTTTTTHTSASEDPNGSLPPNSKLVRYVIDYYEGPSEGSGENEQPVFYLDVRPAVDSPDAAVRRLTRWCGDVWHQAMGGDGIRHQNGGDDKQ